MSTVSDYATQQVPPHPSSDLHSPLDEELTQATFHPLSYSWAMLRGGDWLHPHNGYDNMFMEHSIMFHDSSEDIYPAYLCPLWVDGSQ